MNEWKKYKLGEICTDISYGYTESAVSEPIGPKFLRITDIVPNQINWLTVPYCKSTNETTEKYRLEIGDIVIARTGATTGYNKTIKKLDYETVFASYLIRYKINKEIAYPFFVGYILQSSLWQNYVNAIIGGSAQPGANAKQFGSFEFLLPDLPTQTQIAQILTSFDDKIELLGQMNQTLETMAQAIFKEWFVDFNFPGFDGELVDGLPKGWRKGKLGEIFKTTSGGTPSRKQNEYFDDGTIDWVKSKELGDVFVLETEEKITEKAIINSSAKMLPETSILIAMYGATVGEISILGKPATCNQAICAILPNQEYPFSFIYEYLKNKKDFLKKISIGAAQQNISQMVVQNLEIQIPPQELLTKFHGFVALLYRKIKNNSIQIRTLTQLRDTLLPKLMSGAVLVFSGDNADFSDNGVMVNKVSTVPRKPTQNQPF